MRRRRRSRELAPEEARRAAELLRAELGAPPVELDERVLAAVRREAGRAPVAAPRRARARRVRPRALAVAAAVLAALAVWGPSLGPVDRTEVAVAVPVGRLPAECLTAQRDRGRLEVTGAWSGTEARRFVRVLKRFEAESGIPVTYHYETRDTAAKLRLRIAHGCPPDVALLPQPGLMDELAREGAVRPLDAPTAALVRRSYGPSWRRLGSVDGRLYGVWFKASDKSLLWYRPRALRAAGAAAPPATWRGLLRTGRRLAATGMRPLAIAGGEGWTLTDWFENLYLRGEGPARYDALAAHRIPWTDPSVRRTLRRLARLLGDRALVGSRAHVLETTFDASVRQALGPRAATAMVYEGDFVSGFIPSPHAAGPIRFVPFPSVGGGSRDAATVGGDVGVRLTDSPGARRLLRFLATPRAAEAWARAGGFISPNRLVPASAYPDALSRRAAALLSEARIVRFDLSDLQAPSFGATVGQGMWALFAELAARPGAVDEVARQLEAGADAADAAGG